VCRDVDEVIAAKPLFVKEMCGDAELIHEQGPGYREVPL
jgi:hypothetical protein